MNNFSPCTFHLLIFLCFLIVCYYHLNRFLVLLLLWLVGFVSPYCFKRSFSRTLCKLWFSHHRTGFTFRFSPPRWLDTFPYRCRATSLAAWCNMTTKTKQETYTTPGANVPILLRELPCLRYEWKESSWKHVRGARVRWENLPTIATSVSISRSRFPLFPSVCAGGMVKDGLRFSTTTGCILMPPPSRFQSDRRVWSIDLIYCCS